MICIFVRKQVNLSKHDDKRQDFTNCLGVRYQALGVGFQAVCRITLGLLVLDTVLTDNFYDEQFPLYNRKNHWRVKGLNNFGEGFGPWSKTGQFFTGKNTATDDTDPDRLFIYPIQRMIGSKYNMPETTLKPKFGT